VEVGRIGFLGSGITYHTWSAEARWPGGEHEPIAVAIRLPQRDAPKGQVVRARREARLLDHLATLDLPLLLPEVVAMVEVEVAGRPRLAMVQHRLVGIPIDFKHEGRDEWAPWEVVARVAATCHRIDPPLLHDLIPTHATRRDHALSEIAEVTLDDAPELTALRTWAEAHLPPPTSARLLHGDLLGQNLFINPITSNPAASLGIIDWEYACLGDPAYDLAITTRAHRRPFAGGNADQLVEAYNRIGPEPVTRNEVRLHELCLLARGYLGARDRGNDAEAEQELRRVRNLIRDSG